MSMQAMIGEVAVPGRVRPVYAWEVVEAGAILGYGRELTRERAEAAAETFMREGPPSKTLHFRVQDGADLANACGTPFRWVSHSSPDPVLVKCPRCRRTAAYRAAVDAAIGPGL